MASSPLRSATAAPDRSASPKRARSGSSGGRHASARAAGREDAARFLRFADGELRYDRGGVTLTPTGAHASARRARRCTTRSSVPEKPRLVREECARSSETTLAAIRRRPAIAETATPIREATLWPDASPTRSTRWAMAIDLNACTGCSRAWSPARRRTTCPSSGKDEVLRQREMHWMRIDRYYADDRRRTRDVVHQPMLCQHCENAPCETVCPVLATVHSSEGLNQQVYNRCVGTRYCANNCPYKVAALQLVRLPARRPPAEPGAQPGRHRAQRGVMEKCTFCVQRIQEREDRGQAAIGTCSSPTATSQTACQQTCPAQAIVFGDLNDPNEPRLEADRDSDPRALPRSSSELESSGPSRTYAGTA